MWRWLVLRVYTFETDRRARARAGCVRTRRIATELKQQQEVICTMRGGGRVP